MSSQNYLTRESSGLYSQGNPAHKAPEGALLVADEAVIDREGIIAKRRGFRRYGTALSDLAAGLFEFLETLIVLDGTTLRYDSDGEGTWSPWTGSFTPPEGSRMVSLEASKNFYFTTNLGVWKNDALANTPVQAGLPQPLDLANAGIAANGATLSGTGGSWFAPDSQVAYRWIFTRKDANDNLLQSAPSTRHVVTNPKFAVTLAFAAGTVTVTHTAHGYANGDIIEIIDPDDPAFEAGPHIIAGVAANTYTYTVAGAPPATGAAFDGKAFNVSLPLGFPDGIQAGDTLEIYRSELSADQLTDPGDELFLIFSRVLSSGNISIGYTFLDVYAEAFLGLRLYTNELQEGLAAANDRPPLAHYMAEFKGHVWFAKTQQVSFFEVQLIDLSTVVVNTDTITIDGLAYTFSNTQDTATRKFLVITSGTVSQNLARTAKNLIAVVNGNSSSEIYAFYISGPDDPPGKILFERRTISSDVVQISSTVGEAFLPDLDTAQSFEIDIVENRLYRAKFQQPEAVPYLNFEAVGSRSKGFLGLAATEDYLLIYKEDGLFVASGETDGKLGKLFVIEQRDSTLRLTVPASLVALDNSIIGFTQQGLQKSTGQGSYIVSRAIEPDLKRTATFPDFAAISFSVAYEGEKALHFWTQRKKSDALATVCWRWNYLVNSWTRWRKPASCGLVHSSRNQLYLGSTVLPYVLEERKNFYSNDSDFMDEEYTAEAEASSGALEDGTVVTELEISGIQLLDDVIGEVPTIGWVVEYNGHRAKIIKFIEKIIQTTYRVLLDRVFDPEFSSGDLTVMKGIDLKLEWVPEGAGDLATLKQFSAAQFAFEKNSISQIDVGFKSDRLINNASTGLNETQLPSIAQLYRRGWGRVPWGSFAWGCRDVVGQHQSRVPVPMQHQICVALTVRLRHRMGMEEVTLIQRTLELRGISERTQGLPKAAL